MTINFIKARRDRIAYFRSQELEIERNYRMKAIMSEASRKGMK